MPCPGHRQGFVRAATGRTHIRLSTMLKFLDHLEEWLIAALMGAATLLIFVSVLHRYGASTELLNPWLPRSI